MVLMSNHKDISVVENGIKCGITVANLRRQEGVRAVPFFVEILTFFSVNLAPNPLNLKIPYTRCPAPFNRLKKTASNTINLVHVIYQINYVHWPCVACSTYTDQG